MALTLPADGHTGSNINFLGSSFSGVDIRVMVNMYQDEEDLETLNGLRSELNAKIFLIEAQKNLLATNLPRLARDSRSTTEVLTEAGGFDAESLLRQGGDWAKTQFISRYRSLLRTWATPEGVLSSKAIIGNNIQDDDTHRLSLQLEIKAMEDAGLGSSPVVELGTLQTISISSHREKVAVRALGHAYPKGHTRGPRCIPATEKVFIKDRGLISIADVNPGDLVQSTGFSYDKVLNSWMEGVKECYQLKLSSGYELKASFDHPVKTPEGWVKMKDLKVNDQVFIAANTPSPSKDFDVSDEILCLVGYLIGDGTTRIYPKKESGSKEYRIGLSISDKEMASIGSETEKILNKLNIPFKDYRKNGDKCITRRISVCVDGHARTDHRQRVYNDLHKTLLRFDLYNTYSHTKFLPQEFLSSLSDRQIKLFLGSLWATDGCYSVSKDLKYIEASYVSTSENLVDGIRLMLSKLGLTSIKSKEEKVGKVGGKPEIISRHDAYSLKISNALDLVRFQNKIEVVGKDSKIEPHIPLLLSRVKDKKLKIDSKVFLKKVQSVIKCKRADRLLYKRKYGLYNYSIGVTPRKALAISRDLADKEFSSFVNGLVNELVHSEDDLVLRKVVSIDPIGSLPVYDLEVENRHSFICNSIVVHNTIAGTAIFTVFHEHALMKLARAMGQSKRYHSQDEYISSVLPDQLPPLDLILLFSNEYGQVSEIKLFGVEFTNDNIVFSIEDLFSENVMNFQARDYDPIRDLGRVDLDRAGRNAKVREQQLTATNLAIRKSKTAGYQEFLQRLGVRRSLVNV